MATLVAQARTCSPHHLDLKRIGMRMLAVLLAFMCVVPVAAEPAIAASQTLKVDNNTVGMTSKERKVYKKIKSYKSKSAYREGKKWTNNNSYFFKGNRYYEYNGMYFNGGYGCHAFALKMSDLAFGTKAPMKTHRKFAKIRVGDVVRLNEYKPNMHSVIVLKVVGKKYVVAEANYNGTVHWGRVITQKEFKKTGSYVLTRY